MSADNGGPAFPSAAIYQWDEATGRAINIPTTQGMTLRDHFAGLAMQAILGLGAGYQYMESGMKRVDEASRDAYRVADAMLAARKEPA